MDPALWSGLIALAAFAIIKWALDRYEHFRLFERAGLKGPKPSFISGNSMDIKSGSDQAVRTKEKWLKQYGKIYGYFRGYNPIVVVGDLDAIKQITIKDFSSFQDRPNIPIGGKILSQSLVNLKGESWKEVRKVLTPTFSSSKMRQLLAIMHRASTAFCEGIEGMAKHGGEFDIYDRFQRLTLDVIGESALATKINSQKQENGPFYQAVRDSVKGRGGLLVRFASFFPAISSFLMFLFSNFAPMAKDLGSVVANLRRVIRQRKSQGSGQRTIDVLQLMLDAKGDDGGKTGQLSEEAILANSWVFVVAGFETTATALAYIAHVLTIHQDVQEKVLREIKEHLKDTVNPSYDEIHSLQYLDQVVKEALRLYPPVIHFVTRTCNSNYQINGLSIPAGVTLEIPVYHIHHDPELWPNPSKFDPERFSPENKAKIHPMAHIPFGAGPRNCIGMRFALMEIKLTIIRLVKGYRLLPSARTENPPEITIPHLTYIPKNGIHLRVEPRNDN